MNDYIAFLDEWGNNNLKFTKSGRTGMPDHGEPVSTHFIITAITLRKEQLSESESQLEAVRERFFQTEPIQSAKVGNDDKRRILILQQLLSVPFQVFALVVDKRELRGEGFYYKGSFYKFLHSMADRELYCSFPNLELVADLHGDESFMQGFV